MTVDLGAGNDRSTAALAPATWSACSSTFAYMFTAGRRGTTLRNLAADVELGARVTAACRTKRRKRCTRTRDQARTATSVRLKGFEGKRLPVGRS